MGGVFSWLRNQVRDAVLGGFRDAVDVLLRAPEPEALALEHRPAEEPEPEPARNGRRGK